MINSTSFEFETSLTPTALALLAEVRAATDAGRVFLDFAGGDPRNDDVEELAAELLIEPTEPAYGGGWRAVELD
jgi:hypothetical protein